MKKSKRKLKHVGLVFIGIVSLGILLAACAAPKTTETTNAANQTQTDDSGQEAATESSAGVREPNVDYATDELTGDWNGDGTEDSLRVVTKLVEGGTDSIELELCVSGIEEPFALTEQGKDFRDILSGDFDGDGEKEIVLVLEETQERFWLLSLERSDNKLVREMNLLGFSYDVSADTDQKVHRIYNRTSKEELLLDFEDPMVEIEEITPFISVSGVEQDGREYLETRQRIEPAGYEVVTVFGIEDGQPKIISERIDTGA